MMKKAKKFFYLFVIGMLLCALSGCNFQGIVGSLINASYEDVTFTSSDLLVKTEGEHLANYIQTDASVNLSVHDERLYFVIGWSDEGATEQSRNLGMLAEGEGVMLDAYQGFAIDVAFWNDGVYYLKEDMRKGCHVLYRYDITSGETTELQANTAFTGSTAYPFQLGSDGVLYLVDSHVNGTGYPLHGTETGALTAIPCTYTIGSLTFAKEPGWGEDMICTDARGNTEAIPLADGDECLVPWQDGLLALNTTVGNTLHYISPEGDIVELFHTDGIHAESTVNFHGDYVFLSLQRYESWTGRWGRVVENDAVSGTYRIDMRDYSVEKISDAAYDGLYIFNGSELYATDRYANVYQLDFDGNVLQTLIRIDT